MTYHSLFFPGELLVSDAAIHNLFHDFAESLCISQTAVIVAEGLLIKIAEQVERLRR